MHGLARYSALLSLSRFASAPARLERKHQPNLRSVVRPMDYWRPQSRLIVSVLSFATVGTFVGTLDREWHESQSPSLHQLNLKLRRQRSSSG
jgi:hypothetical protein